MWTLPAEDNPLKTLATEFGKQFAEGQYQRNREARENEQIKQKLSKYDPSRPPSPLDLFQDLSDIKGLSPEKKKNIMDAGLEVYKMHNKTESERFKASVNQQKQQQKQQADAQKEQEDLSAVENTFGPEAAALFKAAPVGARTEMFKTFLDPLIRGSMKKEDFNALLSGATDKNSLADQQGTVEEDGFLFPPVRPPKDLRPKDLPAYRENRRKENLPKFNENAAKIKSAKTESNYIRQLNNIEDTGLLPDGMESLVINPATGLPYAVAQLAGKVNAATQLFIKTITDFTTKAKDTFGSRVTNFDLDVFMRRLPGLLNTPEGRRAILGQMELMNQLDSLFEGAMNRVYQHYGLGDITREEAEAIAEKNIAPQTKVLRSRLDSLIADLDEKEFEEISKGSKSSEYSTLPNPSDFQEGEELEGSDGSVHRLVKGKWVKVS